MAKRRVLAELVDLAILAGWIVIAVGAVGALGAWRVGLQRAVYALEWHALALVLVVVPACLVAGLLESGRHRATPGKRAFGLRVSGQTRQLGVTRGRAIARNVLKYGPALVLVYLAVLAVLDAAGEMRPNDWALVGLAVAMLAIDVAGVFVGRGTGVYDLISGLHVSDRVGRRADLGHGISTAAPRRAL